MVKGMIDAGTLQIPSVVTESHVHNVTWAEHFGHFRNTGTVREHETNCPIQDSPHIPLCFETLKKYRFKVFK